MKKTILAAALAFMTPVAAQQVHGIIVVFDASGSMWGQIGRVTKIEIAREAFADLSTDWAAQGTSVRPIAYGHRRKGDCADIELVSMPEAGSAARLAAQSLRYTENTATVVLLSDMPLAAAQIANFPLKAQGGLY